MTQRTGVALVGCGFVADFYAATLPNHPELEVVAVHDRDPDRARRFGDHFGLPVAGSLDQILGDPAVELVLNLTSIESHFEVSATALGAGKHVYTEKPVATRLDRACTLVELAAEHGVTLSSAPANLLGETAQTLWRELRRGAVGRPLVAYAQLDEGATHRMLYDTWAVESGTPWPYRDELEAGCVLEHAGYYLTWLVAFLGPVERVTRLTRCLVPDKVPGLDPQTLGPDCSIALLEHAGGAVSRLTCSTLAPFDHSLTVVGSEGLLKTEDCWQYDSPVFAGRLTPPHRWRPVRPVRRFRPRHHYWRWRLRLQPSLVATLRSTFEQNDTHRMDFARGPADQAAAIRAGRSPRLSADFCLHVTEVLLAVHDAEGAGGTVAIDSPCPEVEPMEWAL